MQFENITPNSIYAFTPETEPIFGALCLLSGEQLHQEFSNIFGADKIGDIKKRYRFLLETFDAVKELYLWNITDIMLDIFDEQFSADSFYEYTVSMPDDERIFKMAAWSYFGKITQKDIADSITDDKALDKLYSKVSDFCKSFLGLTTFIRQNRKFTDEFFSLVKDLNTPALIKAIKARKGEFSKFKDTLTRSLEKDKPLQYSQELMGKTFHNRGPYETFYFVPSLLLPKRALRLFYENGTKHNKQILFCNILEAQNNMQDAVTALKSLSDETRYQILKVLSQKGPMKGQDIVKELNLAPSTISHHMTGLKESGLITEEPVKTSKYYGIASNRINEIFDMVKKDLSI